MRYFSILITFILLSCNNEKIIQLPEITEAEITEVLDVSPAYIFYDDTQPDSTSFNRKNVISTTNWLVNVDKRLSLKQALPHIQFLQNKRRKASMHKNENAKNYFTCNDTSIKNLGFLEFTNTKFFTKNNHPFSEEDNLCWITFESLNRVTTSSSLDFNFAFDKDTFENTLTMLREECKNSSEILLVFNSQMNFQDYISVKSQLKSFESIISNDEFFY